ncbi:2,3-dehydroadipyl-CoA hydratase [BD1-7 clade bacterium]|uniref:2,3-dehydroadipyl-CoA hydratase n=1 Tax=BD1-7 clade bacterium TaxID=2029982 RepID=A0A5S9PUM7_9GAMM|nr:2,3-dehydroadipyl-CoA hydratase [BD1-7 clade bacterium]CAA0108185.1 2,3-dehydroadipyl-CoA hydratase [BD1-7 clade bacterium]
MSEELLIKDLSDEGVLHLTLNRPSKKNAFNRALWSLFTQALRDAQVDPSVACVVLSGAGKDFSSGMDLNDFSGDGSAEEHPFYEAQQATLDFDKPLIGAAKGIAIGGGATLLFHCDVVYVGESLRMRLPFVSLGLVPEFAASYMLQSIIGSRRAAELLYTAEWINADRAVETGIATQQFTDDQLVEKALEKANEIAQWPVVSLQATKRCVKETQRAGLDAAMKVEREGMDKLAGGPENIEAVMAFIEKRDPNFKQFRK